MGSTAGMPGVGREADGVRRNVSDAVGVGVLGACAAWAMITAAARDGRPEGMLLAVLAVTAGHAAGRIFGALAPVVAPCAGALAGLALVLTVPDLAPGPAVLSPLGHAGATAALLTLSTGAACCAAWAAAPPRPGWLCVCWRRGSPSPRVRWVRSPGSWRAPRCCWGRWRPAGCAVGASE
ncbi:hypothetical protein GCM10020256_69690 [Streptomyces thermocoprophilus]